MQNAFNVLEEGEHSKTIRVGDKCLRIPKESNFDPNNQRIMTWESNCPKKTKLNFTHSSYFPKL